MMRLALGRAAEYLGATAPNPPVGAVITDVSGRIIGVGAHQRAGSPHAEVNAFLDCEARGALKQAHTIFITLEPCNHFGRTPPCVERILASSIRRVVIGANDPNPVASGGSLRLRQQGLEVVEGVLAQECQELIRAFSKHKRTGQPYVTIKRAFNLAGSMIPPEGQTTFTSPSSLLLAHQLRRRADAIITGSGTVLADAPQFTVRHVKDHLDKRRYLVVLDRRQRVGDEYYRQAEGRGFIPLLSKDMIQDGSQQSADAINHNLQSILTKLGTRGALEVLVEAGPTVSDEFIKLGLYDELVDIRQVSMEDGGAVQDQVQITRKDSA